MTDQPFWVIALRIQKDLSYLMSYVVLDYDLE